MFPAFTNIALLAGLAGVTAPILIHLLLRRRSQRMRFSTVQFFVKRDEQSMRKRKLRNLLLLSLRLILFALIVLAFARPYLPNILAGANAGKRQQAIIVLDTSASMQSAGAAGPQWQRAKDAAKRVLASLQADDRAALVVCATHSSTVSGFVPPSVLARKIDDIAPGFGAADLSEGLQQALKVFATANPEFQTTLHLISDLQRPAIQNIATVPLPKELAVKMYEPSDRFVPNVAVTDLRLDREGDVPAHATITSFSDEKYAALPYRVKIDGKEVLAGTVALSGGSVTNLPLAIPAQKAGWHSVEFTIQPKDSLALDDTRYAAMQVPEPIRCIVIEPRPSAKIFQEESFFVAAALNPAAAGETSPSRFSFEKATLDNFAAKIQPQPGKVNAQLIVLPAARQISAGGASALKKFVQLGGGLLVFLGEGVSANAYNTALGDLLPAELERIDPAGESGWHFGDFQKTSPVFAIFGNSANGNLALHEFTERFSLKPKTNAVVLASFNDGAPLVLERKVGEGRIILVNSSADTRWTDWQKHKSFVPWLHSTAFYLSGRNPAEQRETAPAFNSGAEVDLAVVVKEQPVKLQHAGMEDISLNAEPDGVVRDVPLPAPGIYSLRDGAGVELRRVAASIPTAESDLTFAAAGETEQQIARRTDAAPTTLTAGLFGESPHGKELWRLLLVGALVILVLEPIVANRTMA